MKKSFARQRTTFVFLKEPNNKLKLDNIGDQYTFLAIDRKSKLILSHCRAFPDEVCRLILQLCFLRASLAWGFFEPVHNFFPVNFS
jgi:ATPase subunit of ABC transporter with duplicated ATPase domains